MTGAGAATDMTRLMLRRAGGFTSANLLSCLAGYDLMSRGLLFRFNGGS